MLNKNLTKELVTRRSQLTFFNYIGMLPNPDKILKRTGKTIEAYRELKTDAHVWSCIQSRKSGLLSLAYNILPDASSSLVANEIGKIIAGLDIQQLERDILEAPLFGYQPLEIIWKVTEGKRKFIVPQSIIAKPQEWFLFDGQGNLRYKKPGIPGGELPPLMKILCPRYESSYMNLYGEGLLSKCYWPVTFKNGGLRFWVNFMEKYGMPILIGQYTRGASADEAHKLAQELANMTEDAIIVSPSDIDIKLHEAQRSTSVTLYKELIKYCNSEISKAILSQTLTTELDMGSYAAAMTHFRIRREVIQSDIRLVEETINELIRHIVDLNYNANGYPKFKIILNDTDNMQMIDRDVKLMQAGVKLTKQYWMEKYGFRDSEIEGV